MGKVLAWSGQGTGLEWAKYWPGVGKVLAWSGQGAVSLSGCVVPVIYNWYCNGYPARCLVLWGQC